MMRSCFLLIGVTLSSACPAPVFDDDIGVEGVPTSPGALAGSFARLSTAADEVQVPALGPQTGGGITFALVVRSWDGAAYTETADPCSITNFDVGGLHTEVTRETAESVPAFTVPIAVVHETGAVSSQDYYEIWAFDGLTGTETFPVDPLEPRVIDMDGDGNPGATLHATGLATGEVYFAQRKTVSLSGVVRGPDEMFGLLTHLKEQLVVETTSDLLNGELERRQHPDPKLSWWHDVRIAADETGTCDDVDAVVAAGTLSELRPF